jgi:hypothetical protein
MTYPIRQQAGAYGLRPESKARAASARRAWESAGVALHLADDLPGTGSESRRLGCIRHTAVAGLAGASHQIASKLAPTAFGQNQEQVRIREQAPAASIKCKHAFASKPACGQNQVQACIHQQAGLRPGS